VNQLICLICRLFYSPVWFADGRVLKTRRAFAQHGRETRENAFGVK
jgi:hypothetical protein